MKRYFGRLRTRLTYGNVVATLALFAALTTGGAYAASQLAKNSVGSEQIRKGAVGSRALKNGGVAIKDLAKKTRARLPTIETAKVKSDGSLSAGTATGASVSGGNSYKVKFSRRVGGCTYSATPAAVRFDPVSEPAASARITGQGTGAGGGEVGVSTYDATGAPAPSGFHLIVAC